MITEASPQASQARPVQTVLGPIDHTSMGVTDAHNHVWIETVPGSDATSPVLDDEMNIAQELRAYYAAGGVSLLDCQPGGCGRNGEVLRRLALESGVNIIACTGYHRRKYYPPNFWLFTASETKIAEHLISESTTVLEECREGKSVVKAGFIKIALEVEWRDSYQAALEAAAAAAFETGVLIEIHTEKGALAEKAIIYFEDRHINPQQLVLCHMDKRPDFGLHCEIAKFGALLEYDTFYRPKYSPETRVWPLLDGMIAAGFGNCIALATDMADAHMYTSIGNGPGLASLPGEISERLTKQNYPNEIIRQLTGGNIARRLAGVP